MTSKDSNHQNRSDRIMVFVAVLGVAIAFLNIYKSAHKGQPGNAVWAGIALFAFSLLLATQLAKMRMAQNKK
jgi:hypothetical protein